MTKTFTSTDLSKRTGDITSAAMRGPVVITRHNKPAFVMMRIENYERGKRKDPRKVYSVDTVPDVEREVLVAALDEALKDHGAPKKESLDR